MIFIYRMRAIITRSWILAIHKVRIFLKNFLKNKEMVFKNGVKNIQAAAYNGTRTVIDSLKYTLEKLDLSILLVIVQHFVSWNKSQDFDI